MDVKASVVYQSVELNVVELTPPEFIAQGIEGITITLFDPSTVDYVQTAEKSALKDGMDMGEAFLASRTLDLQGTIAGTTRARFYDSIRVLRRIFNPRLAYLADPANKGFLPLYFSVPTDSDEYDDHTIQLKMFLIPRSLRTPYERKKVGGVDGSALSLFWQAQLVGRDPLIYGRDAIVVDLKAGPSSGLNNRGDFAATVDVLWTVGPTAGTITLTIDGVAMVIGVPAGNDGRIIHYDGKQKLLDLTDLGITTRQQGLMAVPVHATVPVGRSTYSQSVAGATVSVATMTYLESYA